MPLMRCRYFVADGVRNAAQETWQRAMGDAGRAAVSQHIDQVTLKCSRGHSRQASESYGLSVSAFLRRGVWCPKGIL